MNTCVFLELRTNPTTGSAYFIVGEDNANTTIPVSYTHLTLPTILLV